MVGATDRKYEWLGALIKKYTFSTLGKCRRTTQLLQEHVRKGVFIGYDSSGSPDNRYRSRTVAGAPFVHRLRLRWSGADGRCCTESQSR